MACHASWAAPDRRPFLRRQPADNRSVVSLSWPRSGFGLLLAVGLGWLTALPAAAGSTSVPSGPLEIRITGQDGLRDFIARAPEDRRGALALVKQIDAALQGPAQAIDESAVMLPHYRIDVSHLQP